MFYPTFRIQQKSKGRTRAGAIVPLFAVLLPVILIFAGFAINLAYMQLVSTELKVATDAASHAGGRAMSIHQTTDAAIAQAELTIQSNLVAGQVLTIGSGEGEDQVDVIFGRSIRGNNGYGMYEFTEVERSEVDRGMERATSLGVTGHLHLPMVFNSMSTTAFIPARRSIATQVDRDIALVLDRSGSMLYFRDDSALKATFDTLYNTWLTETIPGYTKYRYWSRRRDGSWRDRGYYKPEDARSSWRIFNYNDKIVVPESTNTYRAISSSERDNAKSIDTLYNQDFSNNVIYQLEQYFNPGHTLGSSYSSSESYKLTSDMAMYCHDWEYRNTAPRYSRWYYLEMGVDAFIDILDITDQEELLTLATFASEATLDEELSDSFTAVRTRVEEIYPTGGTAIGDGMLTGLPPIISSEARPFAAKTIVVLTDGENNNGTDPGEAVTEILGQHDVTIHTVTFSPGADKAAMRAVAEAGRGRHYHADEGEALVEIFQEIANNLPTILTE